MNVWTLKQLIDDSEFEQFPHHRKLIELGEGWLCAIPSVEPSDRVSKHTPFRNDKGCKVINPIISDWRVGKPYYQIIRWPFIFQAYRTYLQGCYVFLYAWGGLDSAVAYYSIRVYATNKATDLGAEFIFRPARDALVESFLTGDSTYGGNVTLLDPNKSPLPDDGGGFGDFGMFAVPNIKAHFSGEELFPVREALSIRTHYVTDPALTAGLFRNKAPASSGERPSAPAVVPFIHPKRWISPLRPAQTGDQDSFGVWKGFDADPLTMLRLASYESHRPCHWFENDGSFVRAKDHPDLVIYDEKPHWSKIVSPDQLDRKKFVVRNGWENHDGQHDEQLDGSFIQSAIRNTGDPSLIHEAQMMAQRFISRLTVKKGWSTSDPLTGREAGRVFKTLAYLLSVLPKKDKMDLINHLTYRLHQIEMPYYAAQFGNQGKVNYLRTISNDPRVFGKDKEGWIVWEDALAAVGMYMLAGQFGHPDLLEYATSLAESVARHGTDPRTGRLFAHVLVSPGMKDGIPKDWLPALRNIATSEHEGMMQHYMSIGTQSPIPESFPASPGNDKIHLDTGTDFTTWALPCFRIAALACDNRGRELCEKWGYGKGDSWRKWRWMGI